MTIFIAAATTFEILPLMAALQGVAPEAVDWQPFEWRGVHIHPLVTGVGMTCAAYQLGQALGKHIFDFGLQLGIAGVYDLSVPLGTVFHVVTEQIEDLGYETADGQFHSMGEIDLLTPAVYSPQHTLDDPGRALAGFLPTAAGLTVNRVHGCTASIAAVRQRYPTALLENMEGAAFFMACLDKQLPFMCLRSVSNYVAPRDRDTWQIGLAIQQLNEAAKNLLEAMVEE